MYPPETDAEEMTTAVSSGQSGDRAADPCRVRAALERCRVLDTMRSLDPSAKPVLVFAIRWAPAGGATAEEVYLNFGVSRPRFLRLVGQALSPRIADDPRTRRSKQQLLRALARAWRTDLRTLLHPV